MRLRDSNWDEMSSELEGVVKKSARTPSKFVRSIMDNNFSRRKGRDTVEAVSGSSSFEKICTYLVGVRFRRIDQVGKSSE